MNKIIKLSFAFLYLFVTIFTFSGAEALAEEEYKVIYAQVPEDWEAPSVWAWGEDGTAAFEAWPGEAMIADLNNEGWFYAFVPSYVTNIIINANEGSIQTMDLPTASMNAWVRVTSPEEAVLVNDQETVGELPVYEQSIMINAYVPEDWLLPSLWAWSAPDGTNVYPNWPGGELEMQVDGWYSLKVPAWTNSIIINANAGTVQTSDMSIEPQDVWVVVTDTETYEVFYEEPILEQDMITIYAKAPEDWLLPSLWAWSAPDGTNVFPNWPGQELVAEGEWLSFDVPSWVNSVIINGNLGAVQTTDISIEGKDVWIIVNDSEDFTVSYEEPIIEEVIVEKSEDEPVEEVEIIEEEEKDEEEEEESNNGLAVGAAVVGVVAIGGGLLAFTKKKKNS